MITAPTPEDALQQIAAIGKDLELILYKLQDATGPLAEARQHLDCAIRDIAYAQNALDTGWRSRPVQVRPEN